MLSSGAIAGIVVGSVIGLILISLILYCICYRRRSKGHALAPGVGNYPTYAPTLAHPTSELEEWVSQQQAPQQQSGGYDPSGEPVNFGSMQVKGIAEVRGGRERQY
jgi:hypothetical protein